MNVMNRHHAEPAADGRALRLDEEMAEVAMLLPAREAAALEELARLRGLTLGHLLRSLIRDYLGLEREEVCRGENGSVDCQGPQAGARGAFG